LDFNPPATKFRLQFVQAKLTFRLQMRSLNRSLINLCWNNLQRAHVRSACATGFLLLLTATAWSAQTPPRVIKHVTVFQEKGRFAGWPANHGAWSWGDEMLVGFEVGHFHQISKDEHAIDYDRPAEHVVARSLDGGETWKLEKPEGLRPPPGQFVAGVPTGTNGKPLTDCPGGIDFSNPDFILSARMTSVDAGRSRFYTSPDRGHHWNGPYTLPNFDQTGIAARTDYLINGPHDLTMFLTAAKRNKLEGRVICVRTRDGAKTWELESFVCAEPKWKRDYAIMPSSVRLADGTILTAIRYNKRNDLYASTDDGRSWKFLSRPVPKVENPPSLTLLKDGRLAITYGHRFKPFGIRARLSGDQGKTWSKEIVLRADGGCWDLGYPRTLQRPDGKLVTIYYYNENENRERFIGATIWDAGEGLPR